MPRAATDKQLAVLRYIASYCEKCGYSPTIREICKEFDLSSLRGVVVHLEALGRKGLLDRSNTVARTMQITAAGRRALGMAAEPADELRVLTEAVDAYRCLRRQYEGLTGVPEMREQQKALVPVLGEARERMFCLLPAEAG